MTTATDLYEVLLVHAAVDARAAREVGDELREAGFVVALSAEFVTSGELTGDKLRNAIVSADAVVVLFSPASRDALLLVQIGAASSLGKPIFVLRSGVSATDVPEFLKRFDSVPISESTDLIRSLRKQQQDDAVDWNAWREHLAVCYKSYGRPLDVLETDYQSLETLARKVSKRMKIEVTADDVFNKLLRMRKLGQLPDVR